MPPRQPIEPTVSATANRLPSATESAGLLRCKYLDSKALLLVLGMALVTAGLLGADERLTVRAPVVMLAPGHLVVETLVEPDPSNQSFR
jgi:hypothetical protein